MDKRYDDAREPGSIYCPICKEELYAPLDKLSIILYRKCPMHLKDFSIEENNLLSLSECL